MVLKTEDVDAIFELKVTPISHEVYVSFVKFSDLGIYISSGVSGPKKQ